MKVGDKIRLIAARGKVGIISAVSSGPPTVYHVEIEGQPYLLDGRELELVEEVKDEEKEGGKR